MSVKRKRLQYLFTFNPKTIQRAKHLVKLYSKRDLSRYIEEVLTEAYWHAIVNYCRDKPIRELLKSPEAAKKLELPILEDYQCVANLIERHGEEALRTIKQEKIDSE